MSGFSVKLDTRSDRPKRIHLPPERVERIREEWSVVLAFLPNALAPFVIAGEENAIYRFRIRGQQKVKSVEERVPADPLLLADLIQPEYEVLTKRQCDQITRMKTL